MKSLLILLLSVLNYACLAQAHKSYDCDLLQSAINSESFQKNFSISKFQSHHIVIIDTNYYFECKQMSVGNKDILFERKLKYKVNQINGIESQNKIVLLEIEQKDKACKIYEFHFWRPKNNAMLTLEISKKKGKLHIKTISSGSF